MANLHPRRDSPALESRWEGAFLRGGRQSSDFGTGRTGRPAVPMVGSAPPLPGACIGSLLRCGAWCREISRVGADRRFQAERTYRAHELAVRIVALNVVAERGCRAQKSFVATSASFRTTPFRNPG